MVLKSTPSSPVATVTSKVPLPAPVASTLKLCALAMVADVVTLTPSAMVATTLLRLPLKVCV